MRIQDVQYHLLAAATMTMLTVGNALGQSSTGDPTAPLDILRTARQKAQSSQLNATNIATGGNNAGIVITIIFAVVGIALAGFSWVKLYKAAQEDNAREDAGRSLAGLVVGSAITILGVIIGVVTTYMTGNA